jgi:hypothetical protein
MGDLRREAFGGALAEAGRVGRRAGRRWRLPAVPGVLPARNGAVCEQEATKSVENRLTGGMRVLECVVSNSKQKRVRL